MSSEKAKSKSVSMSLAQWELVELACAEAREDRSAYIRRLCLADLETRGYMAGGDAMGRRMSQLRELEATGLDVDAALEGLLRGAA
ncbi:hypothetical protein QEH52_01620 [Coraliomargarita sp. SDUM461003]|uniref:CopG family transcriptional regulator n=1 Tax=Thalassobacterium maritimum TaxID=3041265 RepID=A0ABU1APT8_9BACT|nr:hypothetical protein [Coraliomargarita sp. SDUM461003]MDQ8206190.1 hypothetical protein [Coraliomargarita sp. SDUM461003]